MCAHNICMSTKVRPQSTICFCPSTANPNTPSTFLSGHSVHPELGGLYRTLSGCSVLSHSSSFCIQTVVSLCFSVSLSLCCRLFWSRIFSLFIRYLPYTSFLTCSLYVQHVNYRTLYISNHPIQPLIFSSVVFASSVLTHPEFPRSNWVGKHCLEILRCLWELRQCGEDHPFRQQFFWCFLCSRVCHVSMFRWIAGEQQCCATRRWDSWTNLLIKNCQPSHLKLGVMKCLTPLKSRKNSDSPEVN